MRSLLGQGLTLLICAFAAASGASALDAPVPPFSLKRDGRSFGPDQQVVLVLQSGSLESQSTARAREFRVALDQLRELYPWRQFVTVQSQTPQGFAGIFRDRLTQLGDVVVASVLRYEPTMPDDDREAAEMALFADLRPLLADQAMVTVVVGAAARPELSRREIFTRFSRQLGLKHGNLTVISQPRTARSLWRLDLATNLGALAVSVGAALTTAYLGGDPANGLDNPTLLAGAAGFFTAGMLLHEALKRMPADRLVSGRMSIGEIKDGEARYVHELDSGWIRERLRIVARTGCPWALTGEL